MGQLWDRFGIDVGKVLGVGQVWDRCRKGLKFGTGLG